MEKTQDRPLTDGGHAAGYGRLRLTALAAWIFVLLFSLCLYDALLYTSLKKEVWSSAQSSAQLVARHVCQDIESGMRFGKKLSKFSGLDKLLRHVGTSSGLPVALVDPLGREIGAHGAFPADALNAGFVMTEDIDLLVRGDAGGRTVFVPINSIEGSTHGYAAARVDSAPLNAALWGLFREQLVVQAAGAALGLVVLFLLFRVWGRGRDAHDAPCFTRKGHALAITVFVLVLTASGLFAMQRSGAYYTANLERDLDRTGLLLTDELNRLLLVGVSLDRMDNVGSYLSEIAAMHGNAVMLEIRDSRKGCLATTSTGGEELLTGERTYALLQKGGAHALQGGASCTLHIGFLRGPWLSRLWAMGLDMLTMVAIAVIFMLEILYCLTRGMDLLQLLAERRARVRAASAGVPEPGSVPDSREAFARSSLLRPLSFFMMFAIDMSVSFIPLRMAELLPAGAPSRDMLLGLPISAGMAMTGLAAMVCGTWVKRQGPRPPLMIGFVMVSLGCLGSMLAAEPWHFVLARGLAGAGYGFILVTSQACTVREGLLGDMFAGVYAGSLCGSAMGAMLAERFGFEPVFLLSAIVLACLVPLPALLLKGGSRHSQERTDEAGLTFAQVRGLLGDRQFLAFILLAIIPSSMLCVGFLDFFMPVYLQTDGTAQSDIGRLYMLNCLLVVYLGPLFTRALAGVRSMSVMVCAAGVLSGLTLLALGLLPPLPGSLAGSILLGIATALNIPAQSEFLLKLDIARAIGVEQSMSLLDVLQRAGQVLGPLCAGLVLLHMSVGRAAFLGCALFVAISLLFLLLVRRRGGSQALRT